MEGNFWVDGKDKPIPLDQPLVNQVDSTSPKELWNSRCTRKSIHPKDTPPRKGGAYNSTAVNKDTPNFNTSLSPIMETTINMPQSDGLSFEETIVQDLKADSNINSNSLQTAINTVRSRSNIIQSAQATPTSSSSHFDHQKSEIDNSDNDLSQLDNNSKNQPQHPPSTLELKRLKTELEEGTWINMECIKQNLSMQHHRDLQIVRDETQRRLDDVLSQVRSSKEKPIAQGRQIENLQSQIDQLFQQQQTPPNIATPQHNMPQQHNFSLPPPHTCSYTHHHTQDMFNQSINNTLIGVLDKVESPWFNKIM